MSATTYTNCKICGAKMGGLLGRHHAGNGLCGVCDDDRKYAERKPEFAAELARTEARTAADVAAVAAVLVTTETAPAGLRVAERLGIVSADVAFGAGPFKDITVALRDGWLRTPIDTSNSMTIPSNKLMSELFKGAAFKSVVEG